MSETLQTFGDGTPAGMTPPAGSSGASPSQEKTVSGFDVAGWWKALKVTESPVVPLPPSSLVDRLVGTAAGRAELVGMLQRREELIGAMKEDPLRYGFKPWYWKRASELSAAGELLVMGGNRSGKTEWAACEAVLDLVNHPNRIWAFGHSSADSSKRLQQPRIFNYLPAEWRNVGRGKKAYVNYSVKNGFADGVFILPNGSQAYFFNYMQDMKVLEGYELDGFWADELIPVDWIEAIRYRLVTRKGRLIVTFTPVTGYTPAVGKYVAGAKVIEAKESDPKLLPADRSVVKDCPAGQMPFVLRSPNAGAHVIFFFTLWNPFNPYEEHVKKLQGAQERDVMMRAYGWVEKAGGVAFPKFGSVNIVRRAEQLAAGASYADGGPTRTGRVMGSLVPPRPWENLYQGRLPMRGTNYRVGDPAPLKNWVLKWYRRDERGRCFLYREWPDWASHGAWAVAGKKADGDEGPAQRAEFGKGIRDYKRIILEAEGWVWSEEAGMFVPGPGGVETIMGSIMDPRGGGAAVPSAERQTSILQLLNEVQVDERGRVVGPCLNFREAAGLRVGEGLDALREWMTYEEGRDIDALNCPLFYVVEDCEQSIYALKEYTGIDGEKGMLKDIIDPDRYFRTTPGLEFIGENDLGSVGGGGY